jgi:hypothetical protein
MGFTLPFLSVLHGIATILWICAFISILATGAIFGVSLPGNVPVWTAILFLFLLYGIVVSPMKAARRAYYWTLCGTNPADTSACSGRPHWIHPIIALVDTIVGIIVIVVLVCLAIAYFPELRQALKSFPTVAHQAVHGVKSWWHGN